MCMCLNFEPKGIKMNIKGNKNVHLESNDPEESGNLFIPFENKKASVFKTTFIREFCTATRFNIM